MTLWLSLKFSFVFSISLSSKCSNCTLPASQLGTNFHLGWTQIGRSNSPLPCWCHLTAEWHGNSRVGPDAEGRSVMSRCGFTPLITQTSPLPIAGDSAGKGQPSGSHKDQLAMHVTAPAGPASALPTSHFRDRTNASTRLLIAPKMPQRCLLTRP